MGKCVCLSDIAKKIRLYVLEMCYCAGSGHCGGSLSAAEILAVLYFDKMKMNPENAQWEDRDRFIASKGHCAPAVYATLAMRGFFPEAELKDLRKPCSRLQGHPDMLKLPGIDMSTGSLGMGLSNAVGMALAARLLGRACRIYVLLGDGEINEGQIWEAAMSAAKYKLDNITAILDNNSVQLDGTNDDIMPLGNIVSKWRSFGWKVLSCDGHNVEEIKKSMAQAEMTRGKPNIIIARTIKGKGVSFMENKNLWHGKALSKEEYQNALEEIKCANCR